MSADAEKYTMPEKVTLSVNGKDVTVKAGTTILQAAARAGVFIPTLCYLEKVHPIGSCRICSVEVEGVATPVMSCVTPANDGMKVTTDSDSIKKYRRDMMKMILVNHPLDCPVCERSGECKLQDTTFNLKVTGHSWKTNSVERRPNVDWGLIQYDPNLCIMCERCIKVCTEVQGVSAYTIDGVGYEAKINTKTGEKLDCDFCGQCISVCPVGALHSGMGFSARSWELDRIETICPHCAVGCSFHVNTKNGKVIRITSNDYIGVNEGNLCARGRFGYQFAQSDARLDAPLTRTGTGFQATTWDTALREVADAVKEVKSAYGGSAFVGIGSEKATNEDNYVFQKFFREVLSSGNLDTVSGLYNHDICGGATTAFGDIPLVNSYEALEEGRTFVFVGADGSNENPVVSNLMRRAIWDHSAEVAIAYSRDGVFLPEPRLQLPYEYAKMNEFLLQTLKAVVADQKEKGALEGGVDAAGFAAELEKAGGSEDESLAAVIGELMALIRENGSPVFLVGQEAQRHPNARAIIRNIANLAKLTGGKIMMLRSHSNSQGAVDMGVAPDILPGYRTEEKNELKSKGDILELMENGTAKVLFVMNEDVLLRHMDVARFRQAMKKMEHIIVVDQFFTNACYEADVVFPSTTILEQDGTVTNMEGRCQPVRRAIDPIGQSREAWRIFSGLAKQMGVKWSYGSAADIQKEIAATAPLYASIGQGEFLVDYASALSADGSLKLEAARPVNTSDAEFEVLQDHSIFGLGVYTDYCPSLRPLIGKPYADFHLKGTPAVFLNPADAERTGVSEGDEVGLKFAHDEWTGKARISDDVRPGSIRVPDDVDRAPVVNVKLNGKEYSAVNLAKIRG